ncbi:hypothetical protein ACIOTI_41380 [Streptomyces sp. NPDC087843]|uniref:hypothetical protein n=1 Tax=Streptomyces sp. NPDC087843 TaxID=3365804 RepID=UPI003810DA05
MEFKFIMRVFSRSNRYCRILTPGLLSLTDKSSQTMRRHLMWVLAVVVVVALALGALAMHSSRDDTFRGRGFSVITEGMVCKSLSDPRYDISCGTAAFGDVRFDCPAGHRGKCPRTTSVTLRNVSRTTVTVSTVSGRREGDRRIAPAPELPPGRTVTLRPRHNEKFFFDILVRSMKPGVGMVKVVAVN